MGVHITGIGCISAIGLNVAENLASLKSSKHGIVQGGFSEFPEKKTAVVALSNAELADKIGADPSLPRTALLGMIAAEEAFEGHSLNSEIRTGLISGTSVGGMDTSETHYREFLETEKLVPENYREHPSGSSTISIANHLNIRGFNNTISTACSSGANALMMGARMIELGLLDRVVAGGTDGLCAFTIKGFSSLMIFDEDFCKPFDNRRKGLNLGEGAGFVVLESEASMAKSGKRSLAKLSGWGCTSDAHHQTASSDEGFGAIAAMREALNVAKLDSSAINYVNAHGTATPNNDQSESNALIELFGNNVPPFSSTKAYTGHTLAASGSIEAVYAVLALKEGLLYPNLRFEEIIESTQLKPQTSLETGVDVNHIMSNSFGFGGNSTSLVFSKS